MTRIPLPRRTVAPRAGPAPRDEASMSVLELATAIVALVAALLLATAR